VPLSPALTLGIFITLMFGSLAHLIVGGDGHKLAIYLMGAGIGCALGQAAGQIMGVHTLAVGQINLLSCLLGSGIGVTASGLIASNRLARLLRNRGRRIG